MQTVDHIIHAKWIITCEEQNKILEDHALISQDGKILDILPSKNVADRYHSASIEQLDTHALIPGLINAHTHISMNYLRGLADDLALMNWLNNHIWPAEKKWVSHEFVRDASLFAMAEMIRSGTTCFNDMYFFLQATAEAVDISGMRGAIGITVMEFPNAWAQNVDEYFAKGLEFYTQYHQHERIIITMAPHAIYTSKDESLIKIRDLSKQYQLKINMHIQETADEVNQSIAATGKRPIRRLHEMGLITPDLIAVHMTQINDEDLSILREGKPNIVHCPQSNMKLASGICPVETLRAAGLNIALGTDGAASNNDLNMLDEMRSAAFLAKLSTQNPEALSAEDALKMATIHGAKALGIDHLTGSLTIGKATDFAAIDLDQIETLPLYHPISQIVYAASRQQITDVWVAGKPLMKKRKLTTLDEVALREKAKQWGKKIMA